jgi:hypothetical protein
MERMCVQVTQHAKCRVRVTILPETQSGKHKISLTFLMASPFPLPRWGGAFTDAVVDVLNRG